jgi:hypothetical protein
VEAKANSFTVGIRESRVEGVTADLYVHFKVQPQANTSIAGANAFTLQAKDYAVK